MEPETASAAEHVQEELMLDTVDGIHPLTPPATPQEVGKYASRRAATQNSSTTNTEPSVYTEREEIALVSIEESNEDGTDEETQNHLQDQPTPKTNVVLVEPDIVINDDVSKTDGLLEDSTPIAFPNRSQSLTSLHLSDSSLESSSSRSPQAASSTTPPLSESASAAILSFTRSQRKGSYRKRKKRRERHRK